jgi:acyl-homoserine-lactone acylase
VDLTAACAALAGYDGTGNLNAAGGWLFSEWSFYAPSEATSGSGGFWVNAFNPAEPLTTPNTLNTANPHMLTALADAVQNLEANGTPLDASYAAVQHYTLGSAVIPIPGCATGCFSAVAGYDGTEAIYSGDTYGQAVYGNSVMMAIELTKNGPVADGDIAYSEASNPNSPWYSNMTTLYSEKEWAPLAYTPAQLASESGLTTSVIKVPRP